MRCLATAWSSLKQLKIRNLLSFTKDMSLNKRMTKPPLSDQITELQQKIQLLEAERTGFYESSQVTIKRNKDAIRQLRDENVMLYKKVATVDDGSKHAVKVAFQNTDTFHAKDSLLGMTTNKALETLDRKLQSNKKRLNAQKHITQTLQQRLDELKSDQDKVKRLSDQAEEEVAMQLRTLQNNLEKTLIKCDEAENINKHYLELKSNLQEESLHYPGYLDSLEAELLQYKKELRHLQSIKQEAQASAEETKAEMQQREEQQHKDRKEKERNKTKMEEHKKQTEKVERRAQRTAVQVDDLSSEPQPSTTRVAAEDDTAMSTFEDVFRQIKEALGITDIQEVEERFITQKGSHEYLERLIEKNTNTLAELKEQRDQLNKQFEEKKYTGDADASSEHCEEEPQAALRRCHGAKESLAALDKTLGTVQAGVEHFAVKLQHISLSEEGGPASASSGSDLVDLLHECELKLLSLHSELQGKDLADVMKMINEDKFFLRIEGKMPTVNTRVQLPEDQTQEPFGEDEESDEDEAGIVSREALKRQSQMIVDAKFKKKAWKKK